jgi:hypothetical protein
MRPHKVHVSAGDEYNNGETYIWCECKEDPKDHCYGLDEEQGKALFDDGEFFVSSPSMMHGGGLPALLAFLREHEAL